MRYLNKIIFINSAFVNYAEISVDGNVHFIGTQGMGKSTMLRAILFFYNADKLRLGIEKGKRSFDEYYFPFGNSYIIFEIARETGPFCVLAFKSQGRAAFRFIDGAYDKHNFIGSDKKALPWELVRGTFPRHGYYIRIVDRYEEYRDILYGNNKGLPAEFRKYALLESRQYKNLPRTIQNVFLNSRLDAEFIKQTIIMSLNEEDVKIDLDQYAFHLRDFEARLTDISQWSTKNRSGEIVVRVLGNRISQYYMEINFLEKEKTSLMKLLLASQRYVAVTHPKAVKRLYEEQLKLEAAQKKVEDIDRNYHQKMTRITAAISVLEDKLKEAKKKWDSYERDNISSIIQRVGKKKEWEQKQVGLQEEKKLLLVRFNEISSKYEALLKQAQNQLEVFINSRNTEKIICKQSFLERKEQINKQLQDIISDIETENKEVIKGTGNSVREKENLIHDLKLRKREIELKRYFEKEIVQTKEAMRGTEQVVHSAGVEITGWKKQIETTQKHWNLDVDRMENDTANQVAKLEEAIRASGKKITEIDALLNNSKHSFYTWLHENKPDWENTIGKVIDQDQVLFHTNLSPRVTGHDTGLLFGVEIELSEITKKVKSIADYEADKKQLTVKIEQLTVQISNLDRNKIQEQEKLRKKYQPMILHLKDDISRLEYESQKALSGKDQALLKLKEWEAKAAETRRSYIQATDKELEQAEYEKQVAELQLEKLEKSLNAQLEARKKERDSKIKHEQSVLQERLLELDQQIEDERQQAEQRMNEIQAQSKKVLNEEGADVERLSWIEEELRDLGGELTFIENNRDKVADFNKDKRELFDLVDTFKADKKLNETRMQVEQQKHELKKADLLEKVRECTKALTDQRNHCNQMEEDLQEFDRFQHTEVYQSLHLESFGNTEAMQPPKRLIELINDLNDKSFSLNNKLTSIRSDISKFLSNFSVNNIFGFKTNLIENEDYLDFAQNLKEFLEEDKIGEFERRTNEHFATLIRQIGKETTELVSKEAEIQKVINDINKDFEARNFVGVIKSINLRLSDSANKMVVLLQEIRAFYNDYAASLGAANLFSTGDSGLNNKKAVGLLRSFATEIAISKQHEVNLSDTFELEFRIMENDNDSGWVEKLANVGSEGTDILVKAMINIMLLNVFKESASKRFKEFRLHCMMDEIGKLHPNNVKGILQFANDRNILLINSSPTSYNAMDYRYTYLLAKDNRNVTTVKKLVKNNLVHETV
ncbi:ATP-binding protein [Pontibacter qinzhouensis]|uniref:ATP-binding protein n=1 Tax=Pontibacter qinzhouensis TaxID=2603253 RepID=A0A5C8IZI2_9BACT|nr:ATP-binding protein [Pontibacter qinzhouensis]TXK27234.1 ATP-binding protein [Pontibacter qinzhouensis]